MMKQLDILLDNVKAKKLVSTEEIKLIFENKFQINEKVIQLLKAITSQWSTISITNNDTNQQEQEMKSELGNSIILLLININTSVNDRTDSLIIVKYLKTIVFILANSSKISKSSIDSIKLFQSTAKCFQILLNRKNSLKFNQEESELFSKCSVHLLQSIAMVIASVSTNNNTNIINTAASITDVISTLICAFQTEILILAASFSPETQWIQLLNYFLDVAISYTCRKTEMLTSFFNHFILQEKALLDDKTFPSSCRIRIFDMESKRIIWQIGFKKTLSIGFKKTVGYFDLIDVAQLGNYSKIYLRFYIDYISIVEHYLRTSPDGIQTTLVQLMSVAINGILSRILFENCIGDIGHILRALTSVISRFDAKILQTDIFIPIYTFIIKYNIILNEDILHSLLYGALVMSSKISVQNTSEADMSYLCSVIVILERNIPIVYKTHIVIRLLQHLSTSLSNSIQFFESFLTILPTLSRFSLHIVISISSPITSGVNTEICKDNVSSSDTIIIQRFASYLQFMGSKDPVSEQEINHITSFYNKLHIELSENSTTLSTSSTGFTSAYMKSALLYKLNISTADFFIRLKYTLKGTLNTTDATNSSTDMLNVDDLLSKAVSSLLYLVESTESDEIMLFLLYKECTQSLFHLLGAHGRLADQVVLLSKLLNELSKFIDDRLAAEVKTWVIDCILIYKFMAINSNIHHRQEYIILADSLLLKLCPDSLQNMLNFYTNVQKLTDLLNNSNQMSDFDIATSAEEVLRVCKGSRTLRASLCIVTSRLLMLTTGDFQCALAWAKRGLGFLDNEIECKVFYLEAILLIVDIYDHIGFVDGCISYLAEASSLSKKISIAMVHIVQLHSLRIWHRMNSTTRYQEISLQLCTLSAVTSDISKLCTATASMLQSIHTGVDNLLSKVSACTIQFRYTDLSWNLTSTGLLGEFTTILPNTLHYSLIDALAEDLSKETLLSGFRSVKSNNKDTTTTAANELSSLPPAFHAFQVYRSLRRRAACDALRTQSDDPFRAFLLATASCSTSFECTAQVQVSSSSIVVADIQRACCGDSAAISSIRTMLDRTLTSLSTAGSSGAICCAVYEKSTGTLLLGRYTLRGTLTVSIPFLEQQKNLLTVWNEIMTQNKELLKLTTNAAVVAKWSNTDKKQWWKDREELDTSIQTTLENLQSVLGPWRCIFASYPAQSATTSNIESLLRKLVSEIVRGSSSKATNKLIDDFDSLGYFDNLLNWTELIYYSMDLAYLGVPLSSEEVVEALQYVFMTAFDVSTKAASAIAKSVLASISTVSTTIIPPVSPSSSCFDDLINSFAGMKVTELRAELKGRGASAVGKKEDLVNRLVNLTNTEQSGKSIPDNNSASSHTQTQSIGKGHCVLILDETLQALPLESMPCLRGMSVSRMPGLALLLHVVSGSSGRENKPILSESKLTGIDTVELKNCWYLVDPENNLPETRKVIVPFLEPFIKRWKWTGFVGEIPKEAVFREQHEALDLFIYSGHGGGAIACDSYHVRKLYCPAALLWGCSSAHLATSGVHDANGLAVSYLIGGSPCVVGNLWDVTDKDLDKLSVCCMQKLFQDDVDSSSGDTSSLCAALYEARGVCKMTHAVGTAPVVYGLPITFATFS